MNKFIKIYSRSYLILTQLFGVAFCASQFGVNINMPVGDLIIYIIGAIFVYALSNIAFLIPALSIIAAFTIASMFASLSIPIFLIIYSCEILGSTTINIMHNGFWLPLFICILITPIGLLNIYSLRLFN